jgi:hypothetical protein
MEATRIGNFTSSEIYKLMTSGRAKGSLGAPALTYIDHKRMERKAQRELKEESNARPLMWGKLLEQRINQLLGIQYRPFNDETIKHKDIDYWFGSPDNKKFDEGGTVGDTKCPFTLLSYCTFAECQTIEDVRANHKDGEKYYWQLVSNSILLDTKYAELIVYCPYQDELAAIKQLADNYLGNPNDVAWINWAEDSQLPYLNRQGGYTNIHIVRFEVPQQDKQAMTDRVIEAGELLLKS